MSKQENGVTEILKLGDCMRYQDPPLLKTTGVKARWYIRPYIDQIGPNGKRRVVRPRVYFGLCKEVPKAEAVKRKNQELDRINRRTYIVASQLHFSEILDRYLENYVRRPEMLKPSSVSTYESMIANHIRPYFQNMPMATITSETIDQFLALKTTENISWNSRCNMKSMLHAIFKQAQKWGLWKELNPADFASVGRKKLVYEHKKLSIEQTRALLDELPADARQICEVALFTGLRIGEILGLKWENVNFKENIFEVRQILYQGAITTPKTARSVRDVPLPALLKTELQERAGAPADFVFEVKTRFGASRNSSTMQHCFLKPAAKRIGVYQKGFGFHAFRREAITKYSESMGGFQTQQMAGHSRANMTAHYTLSDMARQQAAVNEFEEMMSKGRAN
jgi:integrase